MRVLDKYILKEFFRNFFLSLLFFTILLLVIRFSEKELGKFVSERMTLSTSLFSLFLQIPSYIIQVAPPSVLFAAFFSLGRMAQNNEITAMRTAGVSLYRVFLPVLIASFILSILMIVFYDQVVTRALEKDDKINKYAGSLELASNVVFEGSGNRVFYIYFLFLKENRMQNVTIYEFDETGKVQRETFAREARWSEETWTLKEAIIREFENENVKEQRYSEIQITVPEDPVLMVKSSKDMKAVPFNQLSKIINFKRASGKSVRKDLVVFHDRISFPFACFIMALLGAPLFIMFGRSGTAVGFLLTMFISFLYYGIAIAVFEAFGNNGKLPPAVSCWVANFLFGTVGVWFVYKVKK